MGINSKTLKSLGFDIKDGNLVNIYESKKSVKNEVINHVNNNLSSFVNNSNNTIVNKPIKAKKEVVKKVKSTVNNTHQILPVINKHDKLHLFQERKIDIFNPYYKYLSMEDKEHIRVVNFIKDYLPDVIAFHVPNEGKKSSFERYKYSLMGGLKGAPDFVFLHPKFRFTNGVIDYTRVQHLGLIIELKAPEHNRIIGKGIDVGKIKKTKGKASVEQLNVINKSNKIGYKACLCFGYEETVSILIDYFNLA